MIYDEKKVIDLFEKSLRKAQDKLAELEICRDRESDWRPKFSALNGWVFEQTVRHCIQEELEQHNIAFKMKEQQTLAGRAKVDLLVGSTAIEIKTKGLFSRDDLARYKRYQTEAKKRNLRYVFLTMEESYNPYKTGIADALGADNVIFLRGQIGEWRRLIEIILDDAKHEP